PRDRAILVPRAYPLRATFDDTIDAASVVAGCEADATVVVSSPGAACVPGTVSAVEAVLSFVPTSPLAANTSHSVTINGVRSVQGHGLSTPAGWPFTTGMDLDPVIPLASATPPGTSSIDPFAPITIVFSSPIDPQTLKLTGALAD